MNLVEKNQNKSKNYKGIEAYKDQAVARIYKFKVLVNLILYQ